MDKTSTTITLLENRIKGLEEFARCLKAILNVMVPIKNSEITKLKRTNKDLAEAYAATVLLLHESRKNLTEQTEKTNNLYIQLEMAQDDLRQRDIELEHYRELSKIKDDDPQGGSPSTVH